MITLQEIDMHNFSAASKLKVHDTQKAFVGSADWIMALAYADRGRNARGMAIALNGTPIGHAMTSEVAMEHEAGFFYIPQLFFDSA